MLRRKNKGHINDVTPKKLENTVHSMVTLVLNHILQIILAIVGSGGILVYVYVKPTLDLEKQLNENFGLDKVNLVSVSPHSMNESKMISNP